MSDVQPLSAGLRPTREGRAYQRGFREGHEAAQEVAAGLAARQAETIRELKAALRTQEAAWKELAGIAARATPDVPGFVVHQIATAGQLACNAALTSTEARG